MSAISDNTKKLKAYCRKHDQDISRLKYLSDYLHYSRTHFFSLLKSDSTRISKQVLQGLFGLDDAERVLHPMNIRRASLEQQAEQISFAFNDRAMNLINHYRHEMTFLHHVQTIRLYFEDIGEGSETERLIRAESLSALSLLHALNLCCNHREWLYTDYSKAQIAALTLDPFVISLRDFSDEIAERLDSKGMMAVIDHNAHLFSMLALASVESQSSPV